MNWYVKWTANERIVKIRSIHNKKMHDEINNENTSCEGAADVFVVGKVLLILFNES